MWSWKVHKRLIRWKRRLPTGAPFDRVLDYLSAWNRLRYRPRLRNPRTFNELFLASKYRFGGDMALARRVTDKVGFKDWLNETPELRKLIVPTLEVFDSAQGLEGRPFPRDAILKPTHLSGQVLMFERERTLSRDEMRQVDDWLVRDFYRESREPTYKGIEKRLILEPTLRDETGGLPKDFKFHMVGGRCLTIQVDLDRTSNHTRQLYLPDWEFLNCSMQYPLNPEPLPRPEQLEAALDAAAALARPFPLCRVDLYLLPEGAIKAGEITFFPGACAEPFSPPEADMELGRKAKAMLAG